MNLATLSQGAESNLSGKFLENIIQSEFKARGIPVFDSNDSKQHGMDWVTQCFVLRDAWYKSIYGCDSRSEFLYRDTALGRDIRIECKWQQTGGSVDEKFPYLLMNAIDAFPEKEVWFVIGGDGARDGGIEWLRTACSKVAAKTLSVLNIPEVRQRIKSLRK